MLVLTRKTHQQLHIDQGRIVVTVLEIRGGRVRLGIQAADDIPIRRQQTPAATSPTPLTTCAARGA
uniref:Carbon storage regulator n=1 Tax=Schlesneria paludicola TaxID=360056 RepID=A0A7C4LR76_9PLAN